MKEVALIEAGEAAEGIAQAFVDARRAGSALMDYPGAFPESLDRAYAIQKRAIRLFGGKVAGWKVGRIPAPLVETYGTNRLTGPIFAQNVVEAAGDQMPEMRVFADGFAAAEAEFLLRIGDLPDRIDREWTNEAAAEHVDRICIGIEVASSPFRGINEHGPTVTISDFGNNNGLVVGSEIGRDMQLLDWPVSLAIDGEIAGTGTAGAMLDGPFGAVRFMLELARDRQLPLAAGHWISTGAVTGVHRVLPGAEVEARFGEGMRVRCRIGAYRQG